MFSLARTVLNNSRRLLPSATNIAANFHSVIGPRTTFLVPESPSLVISCGMKVMGKVRRRCKDCYFVSREERLYVMCKTHGRHKQMSMVKKPKNTWILTHATQGKTRPW